MCSTCYRLMFLKHIVMEILFAFSEVAFFLVRFEKKDFACQ